jgi:putative glycerol-1-phosphate prenyltransferase
MMSSIFKKLKNNKRSIAVLIDPEKFKSQNSIVFFEKLKLANPNFIFIGGSTVSKIDFDFCISTIKKNLVFPIVIFPGGSHQISSLADGILLLSLISGRNPDYLIGHHIAAAEELNEMSIEIISTSYILVDGGKKTSVEYISQTTPLPSDQNALARRIALAGKLQGKQLTYLDAGSGANNPISSAMIEKVKSIDTPLIIGGGIRSIEEIERCHNAGANVVVIGNAVENDIDFLLDIANYQKSNRDLTSL